jgi:hypothetical protein
MLREYREQLYLLSQSHDKLSEELASRLVWAYLQPELSNTMGITVRGDDCFEINIPQYSQFTRMSEDKVRYTLRVSSDWIVKVSEDVIHYDIVSCQLSHGRFDYLRKHHVIKSPHDYECHMNKYGVSFKALLIVCGNPKHFT